MSLLISGGLSPEPASSPPIYCGLSPSFLRTPLLGLTELLRSHRGLLLTSSSPTHAPRARLGPLELFNHAGQHLQQRRGGHPDLRCLLAAFNAPPLHQTPQGWRGCTRPGLISLPTTISITRNDRSRPWSLSPPPCHTTNPSIRSSKTRISGQT